jgi:hypothetical protein
MTAILDSDRVSFDILSFEVAKLFSGVSSMEDLCKAMGMYSALIEGCGWSVEEYDEELLSRIDSDWE